MFVKLRNLSSTNQIVYYIQYSFRYFCKHTQLNFNECDDVFCVVTLSPFDDSFTYFKGTYSESIVTLQPALCIFVLLESNRGTV